MIKTIKNNIEADLRTLSGVTVISRGTLNKEEVSSFPSVSLLPLNIEKNITGTGIYVNTFRCAIAIFEQANTSENIDELLDDIHDAIEQLAWTNTYGSASGPVEKIQLVGYEYDSYNDKTKGIGYVAMEVIYNY